MTSGDLELVVDGTTVQTVGMRFTGVTVPRGATITNAYVQFQVDEAATAATNLTVAGQAADNPPAFTAVSKDISSRPRTTATVGWVPAAWATRCAQGRPADDEPRSRRPGDRLPVELGERRRDGPRRDRIGTRACGDVRGGRGQGAGPARRVRVGHGRPANAEPVVNAGTDFA